MYGACTAAGISKWEWSGFCFRGEIIISRNMDEWDVPLKKKKKITPFLCPRSSLINHLSKISLSFPPPAFAGCFHLFITGSAPSKMCSSRLVNCASKAPMQANREIAHAGIKKLPGPVAQQVIIAHLTAASQSCH